MQIEVKINNECSVDDLKCGEVIKINGAFFMCTTEGTLTSREFVELKYGGIRNIHRDLMVAKVTARLVVG